jgi:two-component sensor histidine kinase
VGADIRKILRSRLPERFAGRVPAWLVELAVAAIVTALFVGLRLVFVPLTGDRAPYAFVFVSIVIAAVLAGWKSGLLALVAGQAMAWFLIVRPAMDGSDAELIGGLAIATLSQLILLIVIGLYQREIDKGAAEREKRLALLGDALREIDHRTRNNYQTVLAMIDLQSRRSKDDGVRDALRQIAERIQAISTASQQLAINSADLEAVRLDDHLCGLVAQIERGLSREEIHVDCDVDDVTASPEKATSISIIVNELVTNAIKHAFNGEGSGHVCVTGRSGSEFELIVADDGRGMESLKRGERGGLGTKLVESFARQLGATHQVTSSDEGTTHRLLIPHLD